MHRFHVSGQGERFHEFLATETAVYSIALDFAIIFLVSTKTIEPREALAAFLADDALGRFLPFVLFRRSVAAGYVLVQRLRHVVFDLFLHEPTAQVRVISCEKRTVRFNKHSLAARRGWVIRVVRGGTCTRILFIFFSFFLARFLFATIDGYYRP